REQQQAGLVQKPPEEPPQSFQRPITAPVGNLTSAIANVMSSVGRIKKGGYNAFHKYHYARMEDLLEVLTPKMGENGIAVFQTQVGVSRAEGNRLAIDYDFYVTQKSGEMFPLTLRHTGVAIARDSKGNFDDKAVAKCKTNALKAFLIGQFQVPSGEFEDSDQDEPQTPIP